MDLEGAEVASPLAALVVMLASMVSSSVEASVRLSALELRLMTLKAGEDLIHQARFKGTEADLCIIDPDLRCIPKGHPEAKQLLLRCIVDRDLLIPMTLMMPT